MGSTTLLSFSFLVGEPAGATPPTDGAFPGPAGTTGSAGSPEAPGRSGWIPSLKRQPLRKISTRESSVGVKPLRTSALVSVAAWARMVKAPTVRSHTDLLMKAMSLSLVGLPSASIKAVSSSPFVPAHAATSPRVAMALSSSSVGSMMITQGCHRTLWERG